MVKLIHTDPLTKRKHVKIRLEIFAVLVVAVLAVVMSLSFTNMSYGNSLSSSQSNLAIEAGKVSTLATTASSFAANVSVQAQKIVGLTTELQLLQTDNSALKSNNSDLVDSNSALQINNSALENLIKSLQSTGLNYVFSIQTLKSTISKVDSINSALQVDNNSVVKPTIF